MAAALVTLARYLGHEAAALFHLLFADDGLLLAHGANFWQKQLFWLYVLELLEVPPELEESCRWRTIGLDWLSAGCVHLRKRTQRKQGGMVGKADCRMPRRRESEQRARAISAHCSVRGLFWYRSLLVVAKLPSDAAAKLLAGTALLLHFFAGGKSCDPLS